MANLPNRPAVEVDTEITESDSAYGDGISAFSASITSSVLNYRKENNRSYHAFRDGRYMVPNDEEERERLDIMHEQMLTMMDGKLFLAPLQAPQSALDLGTGTGIWAVDFANRFPSAEVIGNDLSPIQPRYVPPNLRFLVDDYEDEWVYEHPFDYIHGRYLAYSVKDFPKMVKQAFKNTAPGGWVEFQDWDCNLYSEDGTVEGTSIDKYYKTIISGYTKLGYDPSPGPKFEGWLKDAGYEDIHVKQYLIPLGSWPKDKRLKTLGTWNLMQAEMGFEACAMALLTRHENWSKEEVDILVTKTKEDARSPRIHGLFHFFVVYGRRPH